MKKLLLTFALFLHLQCGHVTAGSAPLNQDNIGSFRDFYNPFDCSDVAAQGFFSDGVYLIYPGGVTSPLPVYCDMTSAGGPWTVFQKRFNGIVNFYRGWNEYRTGFGTADGEHWLGLKNIHLLTQKRSYQLQICVTDFENSTRCGIYDSFSLSISAMDPEEDGYKLNIGAFQEVDPKTPLGDGLRFHQGMNFSTFDKDRDTYSGNCAELFKGASWYKDCHSANLNGLYLKGETKEYGKGLTWAAWRGQYYSMQASVMKIAIKNH
ncbi:microfibril-associated glycoprotein 4-like [Leptodactylus fuscus]|uniref:microfibril-associated glycoprotein 4-like n=1 Tax=Leptodactylus fuscus TaxID=238119 RepID=UPI003F4EF2C2